jgi:CRP-like cAMP-binding protein
MRPASLDGVDEDRLLQLPLFATLGKRDRKRVAPLLEVLEVQTGHELAREGAIGHELFCIEDGTATVSQGGERLRDLGPGDFFGEIALHDDQRRRTSTVVASSPMRLAVIQGHDIRFIERELPDIAEQIRAAIDARA